MQAPFYKEVLQPDEDRFVDQPSVVRLPVAPQVLLAPNAALGEYKLFVLYRCAPGVSVDALLDATLALWQPLLASADHGVDGVVRNRVQQRPGAEPTTVDVVDEVWLSSEAAVRALATQCQAMADDARVAALLVPASSVLLLAHERVMFAGHGQG
jgi:hypothetical protein